MFHLMCFSPAASFIAGSALSAVGAATLTKSKKKSEIPFASIPLLFGIQQLIEGVVWVSFGSASLNAAAIFVFTLFSHVLWPIFLPLSVLIMEKDAFRRKTLYFFSFIGAGVGLYLLYYIITEPVTGQIVNGNLNYVTSHLDPLATLFFYLMATCGGCLFSSHKMVNLFGAALLLSFTISSQIFNHTFISVWCFFAAILSVIVFLHFYTTALRPSHKSRKK